MRPIETLDIVPAEPRNAFRASTIGFGVAGLPGVQKGLKAVVGECAWLRFDLQQLGEPLCLEALDFTIRKNRCADDLTKQCERRPEALRQHGDLHKGAVPVSAGLERRSQLLEFLRQLGSIEAP